MSNESIQFELPKNIDHFLAALSKLYAQDGKRLLQELIVNSKVRVHEGWSFDNWNGGTYGHALYLIVPESLFLRSVNQKDEIQNQISKGLNAVHNVQNEFIEKVFLEMEADDAHDWRKDSGLLLSGKRIVPSDAIKRIWGNEGFRVFFSHKTEVKKETADLKNRLQLFGISCFVAHEDIHPTKAWQDEIENALASMDGFVALLTGDFHDSDWTDQEVGFALARSVPLIAVRLGRDPYGFIGKFQGLTCGWDTAAEEITKVLIKHESVLEGYLEALRKCTGWDDGNVLSKVLSGIEKLDLIQINSLIATYNETRPLRLSWGFNGQNNFYGYGPGLVYYLNSFGSRQFQFSAEGLIEPIP